MYRERTLSWTWVLMWVEWYWEQNTKHTKWNIPEGITCHKSSKFTVGLYTPWDWQNNSVQWLCHVDDVHKSVSVCWICDVP